LPRLQGLAQQLGLEGSIHFQTWMPRQELLARMRACDVFLFTSVRDGGGLVVVEAMASGKPVICLDLAGPGFHVTQECGIKISPCTPDQTIRDIGEALGRLFRDRGLLARMGEAARRRAEEIYDWDKLGARLLGLYEEIVIKSSAPE